MMIKIFEPVINKPINVSYDEWINKPETKIKLYLNNNIEINEFKHSSYYQIEGYFCNNSNAFKIFTKKKCIFNFSKKSFDKELLRHEKLCQWINDNEQLILDITIKRINKRTINFINYEV
jgi:hypothetical protein